MTQVRPFLQGPVRHLITQHASKISSADSITYVSCYQPSRDSETTAHNWAFSGLVLNPRVTHDTVIVLIYTFE